MVHIALMGDPSIRQHVLMPARNAAAVTLSNAIRLDWERPLEDHLGFYIYRLNPSNGRYSRISPFLVTDTFFVDQGPLNGANYYMVRSVAMESGSGGTYLNLGQGVFCSALINLLSVGFLSFEDWSFDVFPNPAAGFFSVKISSSSPTPLKLRLKDLSGRICMEKSIMPDTPGDWAESVDASALTSGMYLLELSSGSFYRSKKIIVGL